MGLTYILIDFENVKPPAADLESIRGADYRVCLFHGPHQNKVDADIFKALLPLGSQVELIQCERAGKNALDFHIAFYLGRMLPIEMAAPPSTKDAARIFVVSKDTGFDALLSHIRKMGHGATRVAGIREMLGMEKAKATTFDLEQKTRTVSAKKQAAVKPAAAKKITTPKEKTATRSQKDIAPLPKNAEKPDNWLRIIENLRDHPNNRPTTLKALERHLTTLLGKEIPVEVVSGLIERMQREGIATLVGKKMTYKFPAR